jgi:predicted GNAT superfamily acetyltransferase
VSALQDLRVAEITAADDLAHASRLYRDVFGYTKPEANLNPRLLMAMAANGGAMVGAWDAADVLVAFGYGFTGYAGGEHYFYSQAVVVADGLQGAGVGRRIKAEQKRLALARDLHRMRWAYNPVLTRNAHFNLSVLGAVGRWFVPDCYGDGESRLVVEWDLDADRPAAGPDPWDSYGPRDWGSIDRRDGLAAVALPSDRGRITGAIEAAVDEAFGQLLAEGLLARACSRQDASTAVYLFAEGAS